MSSDTSSSASPSIYKRVNIRWLPNGFEEPASTLVISSPSGAFVDLRIDLANPHIIDGETGIPILETGQSTSRNVQSRYHNIGYSGSSIEKPSSFSILSWAVGGYARYSSNNDGTTTGAWSQWVSYIPSPFKDSLKAMEEQEDTGVMKIMPDGSTLESGSMVNPATGNLTDYQETWVDVPVVDEVPLSALAKRNKGRFLVAKVESIDGKMRGMIVWVGQACQGILRYTDQQTKEVKITAERWEYDATIPKAAHGSSPSVNGQWTKVFQYGEDFLPCQWMLCEANENLVVGSSLKQGSKLQSTEDWLVTETDFEAL